MNSRTNFTPLKKLFAISLALTYLLVSSGLLLEIHHCMGRIADAGLAIMTTSDNGHCGKCGMEKSNSGKHCCKDEFKQVKISLDQKSTSLDYTIGAPHMSEQTALWPSVLAFPIRLEARMAYLSHAPPGLSLEGQSFLCVFRI